MDVELEEENFNEYDLFALLTGPAGSGKTSVMKKVVYYIKKDMKNHVICVAPTHKARKVLDAIVNQKTIFPVSTCTVASLLNKTKSHTSHTYIGTNHYKSNGGNKIHSFDIFIIDEVSIISDPDIYIIQKYCKANKKKVIFIGDNCQIPHPTQVFKDFENYCEKKDCVVFEKPYNKFELSVILRQSSDNEIVDFYKKIRENLYEDTTFKPTQKKDMMINVNLKKI